MVACVMSNVLKRIFVGHPLKSNQSSEERLTKRTALAVFSSDALSSVAYATEEILLVLVLAGSAALGNSLYIAFAIVALLVIVVLSYGQTIHAYPSGGGAYIVAKDNLGEHFGLTAGAALLIDYILTVSVSVSAGIAAVTSAFPALYGDRVPLAVLAIALITIGNLRGIRESGKIFAIPAYFFIVSIFVLIVVGLVRISQGTLAPVAAVSQAVAPLTLFLILRAFAAGCTALTGVEAISNGVQAFKRPESRNARLTLYTMGAILAVLFIGITVLARYLHLTPVAGETLVSQIAASVFGRSFIYFLIQAATALILILAANTSFADFPRLASILARDRFLPIQLVSQGDRLVFSNGILLLATVASLIVIGFGAETNRIIPLYAIGVFISFSLSQFGMVVKWFRERHPAWLLHAALNGTGAIVTTVVFVIIAVTKFRQGAWAVLVIIPVFIVTMFGIRRHYQHLKTRLTLTQEQEIPVPKEHIAVLFVGDIHKGAVAALRYAKTIQPTSIKAIHISFSEEDSIEVREKWNRWGMDVPLIIAPSPYRRLIDILMHYIREIERQNPMAAITVILPEFICPHWWQLLLHNQTASRLKHALLYEHVSVVSVPIQLKG